MNYEQLDAFYDAYPEPHQESSEVKDMEVALLKAVVSEQSTFATLEQWIRGWRVRILEQGKAPYYYVPASHEWIETKGDLVRIVNREYPGVTYVSLELFNAKAQPTNA